MIRKTLLLFIIPLLFSCKKEPVPHYEIEVLSCENPYLVNFKSLSENTTLAEWYIDGQYHIGDQIKLNLHSGEAHTLQLIASNDKKRASVEAVFQVEDYYQLPTANFTYNFPDCETHEYISFYNRTEGVTDAYFWDFGDGSTSTALNPSHTYSANGTYLVKICAIRCTDSIWYTANVTIDESNVAPKADFKANATNYKVANNTFLTGATVVFNGAASNNSTQLWRLWDGTLKTGVNFSHKFYNEGEYVVEFVAICGDRRDSITQLITIRDPEIMTISNMELASFDDENDANEAWDEEDGRPDIYLKLKKGSFTLTTTSTSSDVSSTSTPSWSVNEELSDLDDDYKIEIWDKDSGSDDLMYTLTFEPDDFLSTSSYPNNIDISYGDWEVELAVDWE